MPMMLSSLRLNQFVFFFLIISFGRSEAGKLYRRRIIPQRRDASSLPGPSTTPSLKDAASAILEDAEQLSALPQDILNFVVAVEDNLDDLESKLNQCSATPSSGLLPPPLATSIPSPSTVSSSITESQPYTPDTISSSRTTTSTSRITTTITIQNTVSVYKTSYATRPSTAVYATTAEPAKYTNTTLSSTSQPPSSSVLSNSTYSWIVPTSTSLSTSQPLPPTSQPLPSSKPSSNYIFNPNATNNVAVYYGQTPDTTAGGLLTLCQDPSVDIIILAFLDDFFHPDGYPTAEFGPGCSGSTPEQLQSAPGLPHCSSLATEITQCQTIGKPILLSLGGSSATTAFSSADEATQFAATLWNLFGAGTDEDPALRPFGDVVLDGFDIDNEDHSTNFYDVFASALRAQTQRDSGKKYYISAAPQCPRPDASIPLGAMQAADFVWVQFYNNPECNLGSSGFLDSFRAWSNDLAANASTGPGPRLYIGGGAWSGAGSGFVEGNDLVGIVGGVQGLDVPNFGGMMFWDGTEGLANKDANGKDYLDYAKEALG